MKFLASITLLAAAVNAAALGEVEKREAAACDQSGQPCWRVARAAEAFASVLDDEDSALVARNKCNPKPENFYCGNWCQRPGSPCWKARRGAEALASAVAEANPELEFETLDIAKRYQDDDEEHQVARRAAEAVANIISAETEGGLEAREPIQKCNPKKENFYCGNWCQRPGSPCWKAVRDLEAMEVAARSVIDQE